MRAAVDIFFAIKPSKKAPNRFPFVSSPFFDRHLKNREIEGTVVFYIIIIHVAEFALHLDVVGYLIHVAM